MFVCKFSTLIWLLNSEKWQFFNITKELENANRRTKPSLTSPKSQSQRIWNHMDTRLVHTHNIWWSKAGKLLVSMTQSYCVYWNALLERSKIQGMRLGLSKVWVGDAIKNLQMFARLIY